jgi:hypothetical protein
MQRRAAMSFRIADSSKDCKERHCGRNTGLLETTYFGPVRGGLWNITPPIGPCGVARWPIVSSSG